jgi:hypothetical protein
MMKRASLVAIALGGALLVGGAQAATVPVSFSLLPGAVGQGTSVFRADLSGLGLSEIQSITLIDSNSRTGGSSGAFSGFDLDAIKLSTTLASTAAEASTAAGLAVFDFTPVGTFFTPGTQRPPAAPKLHGTDASGSNVDPAFATLSAFDAVFFGPGGMSLGDGGSIAFNLVSAASASGLYLYLGEIGTDPGESIAGALLVSSLPIGVSEPAGSALLLSALGIAWLASRRRRVARTTAWRRVAWRGECR